VEFTQWTQGGKMRHPIFKGMRYDKSAKKVVRE
jgi:bifunctional non-homologous end joining protein LigD